MSSASEGTSFRTLQSFQTDYVPTTFTQYESARTGMRVVTVDSDGPKVYGFFTLATEIHDDSGAPHTLEHLVFMGSKSYQYKGVLDKLATRAYSATNAWTATDHTAYTLEAAGWEGFAQILPVYLEHVLLPTLTDAGCYTEVHHVDGTGNDAGVVYSEMQGVQNLSTELMDLRAKRLLYPENVGFRYETGGMMEQLRILTADHIRAFHRAMYQPKNLCLIIIGRIDHQHLLATLDKFEGTILDDIPSPNDPWKRPWIDSPQPPALATSVVETVEFPEEDESSGEVLIEFLGPGVNDTMLCTALSVLLVYLAGSSVSVMENTLVEKEQVTSAVVFSTEFRPDTVIRFSLESVATEKLAEVEQRFFQVLQETQARPLDMKYLLDCIRRHKRQVKYVTEGSAREFSDSIISDFLFGERDGSTLKEMESLREYDALEAWTEAQWKEFLSKWLADAHHVSILGRPSAALSATMKADEKRRVKEQQERLGEEGLKRLEKQLAEAKAANDVEIPRSMLEQFTIPGTDSIHFIKTTTARAGLARKMGPCENPIQGIVDRDQPDLPLFIQFEHVPTNFVHVNLVLSTGSIPVKLRPYLSIYLENFFNLPITRNGQQIGFEQVVTELEKDTVAYSIQDGSHIGTGEVICIGIIVEPQMYVKAIEWLKELMTASIFTEERLKATLTKLLAEIPDEKRDGYSMVASVRRMLHFAPESLSRACNTLVKALHLRRIKRILQKDPGTVIAQMEELREALYRFENMRVLLIANVEKLPKPVTTWAPFVNGLDTKQPLRILDRANTRLSAAGKKPGELAHIVPMPAIDSSYSLFTARGLDSYTHPQLPALMVAIAYLDAAEGPMWCAVRGTGLAYGTGFQQVTQADQLIFRIYRSPDTFKAYAASKKVIESYIDGSAAFDPPALQGAISSIVMAYADEQPSMVSAAQMSFIHQVVRDISTDYNEQMLKKVREVTVDQIKTVLEDIVLPIFLPGTSDVVVTCAPIMEESLIKSFTEVGFKPEVHPLSFFQDDYGLVADADDDNDDDDDGDDDEEMEDGDEDEEESWGEIDEEGEEQVEEKDEL
ncbi:MAG: hypothetical protein M1838_001861 [Thelocarpon superellum]|nr:MAG: hypothetical protein M1838_001861 [Thelocarpon superellum]